MTATQLELANSIPARALSVARKLRNYSLSRGRDLPMIARARKVLASVGATLRPGGVEKPWIIIGPRWVLKVSDQETARREARAGIAYASHQFVARTVGMDLGIVAQDRGVVYYDAIARISNRSPAKPYLSMYDERNWPRRTWRAFRKLYVWANYYSPFNDFHGGNVALFGSRFKMIDLSLSELELNRPPVEAFSHG